MPSLHAEAMPASKSDSHSAHRAPGETQATTQLSLPLKGGEVREAQTPSFANVNGAELLPDAYMSIRLHQHLYKCPGRRNGAVVANAAERL
jgi:hypothetical protein